MLVQLAILAGLTAPIEVVYHADLEGRMAVPRCGEPGPEEPDYAAQVAAIRQLRQDAADRGAPPPIVLLGGDEIAPDLFVRGILKRDTDAGARDVAAALARAGYDAIAVGNHELSTERDRFERFAAAVTAAGMPLVWSNVTCDKAKARFCSYVRSDVLIERGGQQIGILAVLAKSTAATIAADKLVGIELEDPAEAITEGVARLRAAGAAAVIVMVQINSNRHGQDDVLALQLALGGPGAPDVLLSSGLSDADGRHPTLLVRQDGSPALVGSSAGTLGVTHVVLEPRDGGTSADATAVASELGVGDDEVTRILAPHVADYCQRYSTPIGGPGAPVLATRDALIDYALAVMRRTTNSEIAIVNRGFVFGGAFPVAGAMTLASLKRAMPHPSVLGTVKIRGAALADVLAKGEASGHLAMLGAARPGPGKSFQINGRPIEPARTYRIATIDFVAQGGDAIYGDDLKAWRPVRNAPDVRDLVQAALARSIQVGAPASDRLLTVAIGDLGVDLLSTAVSNRAGLTDSQLSRAEQRAIKLELVTVLQLDHPLHRMDARMSLKYGYARTQPQGMPAAAQETLDLVQGTALYSYRGFTHGRTTSAAVPDPYSRLGLETELTVPDTRTYRHAELTHTVGALFTLRHKLKLRAGAGYRTEIFASSGAVDPEEAKVGRFRFVAEAGAALDPVTIATFRTLAVTAEGSLDYFLLDPARSAEHQLRASGKLSLPILPLLFLTVGVDAFGVERKTVGRGGSVDLTLGLKLHLDAAHQAL